MRRSLWLHAALDPIASGELRRLGMPAAAIDGDDWACEVVPAPLAGRAPPPSIVIAPIRAAWTLPLLPNVASTKIIIEVDSRAALARSDSAAILRGLSNRITGVVARGPRAAAWSVRTLGGDAPVWLVPDPAVRKVELSAVALQLGLAPLRENTFELEPDLELWFAEPGDHIESGEVAALAAAWAKPEPQRLIIAPPIIRNWLTQAGVAAKMLDWDAGLLHAALQRAASTDLSGAEGYGVARRSVMALRSGGPAPAVTSPSPSAFDPGQVTAAWQEVFAAIASGPRRSRSTMTSRILVFLDLIQDLDPMLALLDEFRTRRGVDLKIVVSTWLFRRSPRVPAELKKRGLAFNVHDRPAVVQGLAPTLDDVDAVVGVAESSLAAHAPVHALFQRARTVGIPTFAMQHGVENVGLHPMPGEGDIEIAADYLFVWFSPKFTPARTPAGVAPRLIHTGRPKTPTPELASLSGAFASFDSIVAVFENLHWKRYDQAWRLQFLADCTAFAAANPGRAVILKPHHAGLWSVKHRHLIPEWPSNLILADPTDPFWEPYTAAALVNLASVVITTPSTVALDAAQAGKPVAIAAYGLDLPAYAPLFFLQAAQDWQSFVDRAGSIDEARNRAAFVVRTAEGERAAEACVDTILAAARAHRPERSVPSPTVRAAL